MHIETGSPWENGYCESFSSKLRDEFLNGEILYSIQEVRVPAERCRVHYNTIRPHSSLGYRSPAREAWLTVRSAMGYHFCRMLLDLLRHPPLPDHERLAAFVRRDRVTERTGHE